MSNVGRGIAGERRAWHHLEDLGYLVSSRRHVGGAGDLLAIQGDVGVWFLDQGRPLLIEVKTSARAFSSFPPADRNALLETAHEYGCEPLLCWWPTEECGPFWIEASDWPEQEDTDED